MTSASTPGPLNPGNVVSAALRLYRDRFKTYAGLSLIAILWIFLPFFGVAILAGLIAGLLNPPPAVWVILALPGLAMILYGWAKYMMYAGLLSRLSFRELMNDPETPAQARQQLQPKIWSFLLLAILMALIFLATYFLVVIGVGFIAVAIGLFLGFILNAAFGSGGSVFATIVASILGFLGAIFCFIWVFGRVLISEVPLSVEAQTGVGGSVSRSWQLTKRSVLRIQFVVLAAFLVSLPAYVVLFLPQFAISALEPGSTAAGVVALVSLVLNVAINVVLLPFWQVIKGVLYYDLRSRREGLDLTM